MKIFLILSLVTTSAFTEAPYPPSGYRPQGPQFDLPPRKELDVETFSDGVVIQDATDRQLNRNDLWPTWQQLPSLEPAKFRTHPLNVLPLERATTVEFYQAPLQLLRTEINYPLDRKSPIIRTSTFANLNEQNIKTLKFLEQPQQSSGETTTTTTPTTADDGNGLTQSEVDEHETTTTKTIKKATRSRSGVRQKTSRTSTISYKEQEGNTANDLLQLKDSFPRNPPEGGGSNQRPKQRLRTGTSSRKINTNIKGEPLKKSTEQDFLGLTQGEASTSFDYDNNFSNNPESGQIPQDTYGVPAVDVTTSRPRRRKTRRRKVTTTTTTTTTTTEAPEYSETEEPVPETDDPNVAISTAVAGLPPSVYVVQEPTSGQLRLLRLQLA